MLKNIDRSYPTMGCVSDLAQGAQHVGFLSPQLHLFPALALANPDGYCDLVQGGPWHFLGSLGPLACPAISPSACTHTGKCNSLPGKTIKVSLSGLPPALVLMCARGYGGLAWRGPVGFPAWHAPSLSP